MVPLWEHCHVRAVPVDPPFPGCTAAHSTLAEGSVGPGRGTLGLHTGDPVDSSRNRCHGCPRGTGEGPEAQLLQ